MEGADPFYKPFRYEHDEDGFTYKVYEDEGESFATTIDKEGDHLHEEAADFFAHVIETTRDKRQARSGMSFKSIFEPSLKRQSRKSSMDYEIEMKTLRAEKEKENSHG
jgi:hypothetical protein